MAAVQSIAKAQATGYLLEKLFNVPVSYDYKPDHVRLYYQPDRLKQVQDQISKMAKSGPSDVRVDWFPMVSPIVIREALPYALGLVLLGFIAGKVLK